MTGRSRHISEISFYSVGVEAACRYLTARLLSVTTSPLGKTATSWYLSISGVGVNLATLLFRRRSSSFSLTSSDRESHTRREPCFCSSSYFIFSAADCAQDDKKKIFATVEKLPPPQLLKRPLGIMRFDTVISRLLRKLCFSDVIYLVLC